MVCLLILHAKINLGYLLLMYQTSMQQLTQEVVNSSQHSSNLQLTFGLEVHLSDFDDQIFTKD